MLHLRNITLFFVVYELLNRNQSIWSLTLIKQELELEQESNF